MGVGAEEHHLSHEVGSWAGESTPPQGAQPGSRKRLIRTVILGIGALILGIAVIFSAGSDYSWEVGAPLFHLGAAVCWLGRVWGKRSLGIDLITIGIIYVLAGCLNYLIVSGSEQYPPEPDWPCYVIWGLGGMSLVSGIAVVALRRRAHLKAGTQMPAAEVRRRAGTWLMAGGLAATCLGLVDTLFMALAPPGMVAAIVGGALLSRRVLGMTLMGVGLLCALHFLALSLRFGAEVARSASLVVVMAICMALALMGSVIGAVIFLRVRGARAGEDRGTGPSERCHPE